MDDNDLSRMNAMLRHRLRNFASGIKTAIELLSPEAQRTMPPESLEYFPLILNECNAIRYLTEHLNLFFDNIPDGGSGAAAAVLEQALADIHKEFPGVNIDVANNSKALKTIIPAAGSMRLALLEILRNAIESDGKKGIRIKCHTRQGSALCFQIDDRGHGVPRDDLEKIFLPFYTTRSRHMGIGLNIARKLTAKSGGIITVRNNPGGGLTVEITIPAATA